MSKAGDTTGVLNNTSRVITLKAQTKKRSDKREVKRFKTHLEPGVLNMVPTAMWKLYQDNKVVQAMLAEEKLITGRKAVKLEKPPKIPTGPTKEEIEQQAILRELEANESGDEENGNKE